MFPTCYAIDSVREVAKTMTFACATDGNHGRSVAQGAQFVGAPVGHLRPWMA